MPDPITHTSAGLTVTGTFSAVLSFVFGVPAPMVFAAFSGACFAVAMSPVLPFRKTAFLVFGGTVASSFITPLILHYFDGYPQRGAAAVIAFILLYFREPILNKGKQLITRFGGE